MSLFFLILISVYVVFLFGSLIGFLFFNGKSILKESLGDSNNKISVIIPFRNEALRINDLLNSLNNQIHNDIIKEVIFIDDHSTDDSCEIISSWISTSNLNCCLLYLKDKTGKKHAINLGVNKANSNFILNIDADVCFSNSFFQNLCKEFKGKSDLYLVSVIDNTGIIWSKIESSIISVLTIGMANLKLPILANGAALLFKRKKFIELNPFKSNYNISSGDDLFILESFRNNGLLIDTISPKRLFVFSKGAINSRDFIQRSIRWSGKMSKVKLPLTKFLGIIVTVVNLTIIPFIFLIFFYFPKWMIVYLLAKLISDLFIALFSAKYYNNYKLFFYSFPMFFLYPLYISIVMALLFVNYPTHWKGRLVLNSNN